WMVGAAAAKLVIHERRAVLAQPFRQRLHVVAGRARSAVEDQDRHLVARPESAIPDATTRDVDVALVGGHAGTSLRWARNRLVSYGSTTGPSPKCCAMSARN